MARFLSLVCIFIMAAGCSVRNGQQVKPGSTEARYLNEFGTPDAVAAIGDITRSVRKVVCVGFYTTYQFTPAAYVTPEDIATGTYRKKALGTISTHETTSGTGTIIFREGNRIALLTCAHILDSPDTLISWFAPSVEDPVATIKSFSIREKRQIYVRDLPTCGPFAVLASDPANDIALLGRTCDGGIDSVGALNYPPGRPVDLEWGSQVYILGYPHGSLTVARGIVSNPRSNNNGVFTVDAVLNKGCSGGIILAKRAGSLDFELVGMVQALSTSQHYYLKPEKDIPEFHYSSFIPYPGNVYVGTEETINYGINYIVPISTITEFYKDRRAELRSAGYDLDAFFLPGPPPGKN
jgi:hypothetical protein